MADQRSQFKFNDPRRLGFRDELQFGLITPDEVANLCDPFNCECRAYGRLKEAEREDLAVKCYGYLCLDAKQEALLKERGFDDWARRPEDKDEPIRATVKELIDKNSPHFRPDHFSRMRRDILDLNALGIIVWDVRADNYLNGRLIDLSQAHVSPHHELDWDSSIVDRVFVEECCTRDMACFDQMMTDWNKMSPPQLYWRFFFPSVHARDRLRRRRRHGTEVWELEGARFDAAFYDWKRSGEDKPRPGRAQSRGRLKRPLGSTRKKETA